MNGIREVEQQEVIRAARAHYDAVSKEGGRIWAEAHYKASQIRDREIAAARARDTYEQEMLTIENRFDRRMWPIERRINAMLQEANERLLRATGHLPPEEQEESAEADQERQILLWEAT